MAFKIIIAPVVDKQIDGALSYYLSRVSNKTANNLYDEIQKAIQTISLNPYFPIRKKNYRAFPLSKFPYLGSAEKLSPPYYLDSV